jgi:hypothetical protein
MPKKAYRHFNTPMKQRRGTMTLPKAVRSGNPVKNQKAARMRNRLAPPQWL